LSFFHTSDIGEFCTLFHISDIGEFCTFFIPLILVNFANIRGMKKVQNSPISDRKKSAKFTNIRGMKKVQNSPISEV
jgi:hypothetical protein